MSIRRHTLQNLAGSVAPLAVSLVTVPIYLHLIGPARYGILAIVWLFIGYFGVFDFGLSRATSFHIASHVDLAADANPLARSNIFWTALCLNGGFGLTGGLLLYLIGRPVFEFYVKMPLQIRPEVMSSLPWIAACVPMATLSGVLIGALEARLQFLYLNTATVAGTFLFQTLPLSVAYFCSPSLKTVIPAAIIAKAIGFIPLLLGAVNYLPAGRPQAFELSVVRKLFGYGGWITVSNLIIPFLATLDKMLIGVLLGSVDVTRYTLPDSLTRNTSIFPGAIVRALFPQLAALPDEQRKVQSERALEALIVLLTLIIVPMILFMHLFFILWIGHKFADISAPIGSVLSLGIFINGIAFLPATYLQASARVKRIATFHIIEIVPHVIGLYVGIRWFGLLGAAWSMVFVSLLDALLLLFAASMPAWRTVDFWSAVGFVCGAYLFTLIIPAATVIQTFIAAVFCLVVLFWAVRRTPEFARFAKSAFGMAAP